jgi:TorA maturation chaperone TorD
METKDFVSHESFKMEAYQLFASCYYLPGQELATTLDLLERRLKIVCPQAAKYVLSMTEEIHHRENPERLAIEYARLFVGPYGLLAPPYGSVYLEDGRQVMGDSTMHAMAMYAETGLDVAVTFNEAPDHIAAELEFVHFLIFKSVAALGNAEVESAMRYLDMRRAFLQNHLGAWISDFARQVEENTATPFYGNLAKATRTFIQKDLEEIIEASVPCEVQGFLNSGRQERIYLQD